MKRPKYYGLTVYFSNEYVGEVEEREISTFLLDWIEYSTTRYEVENTPDLTGTVYEYLFTTKRERTACIKEVRKLAYENMEYWNVQVEETP